MPRAEIPRVPRAEPPEIREPPRRVPSAESFPVAALRSARHGGARGRVPPQPCPAAEFLLAARRARPESCRAPQPWPRRWRKWGATGRSSRPAYAAGRAVRGLIFLNQQWTPGDGPPRRTSPTTTATCRDLLGMATAPSGPSRRSSGLSAARARWMPGTSRPASHGHGQCRSDWLNVKLRSPTIMLRFLRRQLGSTTSNHKA